MPDFRKEFPHFDPATMPTIPDWLEDCSWRNDACPCFVSDAREVELWIDFADPADRERPESKRFCVQAQRHGINTNDFWLDSDDWNEVLAFLDASREERIAMTHARLAVK